MAKLLTLPMEVLKMVAKEGTTDDLPSMRLVCRRLDEASMEVFGARNFRHRRCTVTPKSLQALEDISNHPVFQHFVRSITFGSYILRQPSELRSDIFALSFEGSEHTVQIATDQWCLIDNKTHASVLAQTLRNFRSCGNTEIVLGIFDDVLKKCGEDDPDPDFPDDEGGWIWFEVRKCYGHEFYGTLRLDDHFTISRRAYVAFDMLRDACEMASVPFNNLSLDLQCLDDNTGCLFNAEEGYSAIAFGSKLAERLDSYLQIGEDGRCMGAMNIYLNWNQGSIESQFSQGHLSLQQRGQRLALTGIDLVLPSRLRKESWPRLHSRAFGPLGNVVRNAYFRTIVLRDLLMDTWALVCLVLRNAACLMHLELRNIHIARDDSLGTNKKGKMVAFTERLLGNCPNLEQLCIDTVTLGRRYTFATSGGSFGGPIALHGNANVRPGLEQLLEKTKDIYSHARSPGALDITDG